VSGPAFAPSGVGPPVRLQTHVWNSGGDRRALLIHGLCSDGVCWWRLASWLADAGWLVLAPDLRGHGRSPTADRFDLPTLAADVAALGSGWELVVGHSLGGAIAATLLTTDADIGAAVLVDPVLQLGSADRERIRRELRAEAGGVEATTIRAAHPSWDERDVWRKVLATRAVPPDVVDAVLDHNDPWDLFAAAEQWRARVHLLAADPALGATLDMAVAHRLADGRRVTAELVSGSGHSIHREQPQVVTGAVTRVLGGS
jgi:pimeloyl-ACP methyl ester carboxylesterase